MAVTLIRRAARWQFLSPVSAASAALAGQCCAMRSGMLELVELGGMRAPHAMARSSRLLRRWFQKATGQPINSSQARGRVVKQVPGDVLIKASGGGREPEARGDSGGKSRVCEYDRVSSVQGQARSQGQPRRIHEAPPFFYIPLYGRSRRNRPQSRSAAIRSAPCGGGRSPNPERADRDFRW